MTIHSLRTSTEALQWVEVPELTEKFEKLQKLWDKRKLVKESKRLQCLAILSVKSEHLDYTRSHHI